MAEMHEENVYTGKDEYLSIIFIRWRWFHIATMLAAFISSFIACFSFVAFDSKFEPYCPLFATIRVDMSESSENVSYVIIKSSSDTQIGTEWGDRALCDLVLYVPIVDMLAAMTGLLLFCSRARKSNIRGGFSHKSQLNLVPPTCISGFIMTGLSFVGAMVVSLGGSKFCNSFKFNILESCRLAQSVHWRDGNLRGFEEYLTKSQVSYWLMTHAWMIHSVMTLCRWTTNVDYVIAEERELYESPVFANVAHQTIANDVKAKTTLNLISRYNNGNLQRISKN